MTATSRPACSSATAQLCRNTCGVMRRRRSAGRSRAEPDVLPEDVCHTVSGQWLAAGVSENGTVRVGVRRNHAIQRPGCLRPERTDAFFLALAAEPYVSGGHEPQIGRGERECFPYARSRVVQKEE
jgi:hypothetical protein